jgi:hypothetical protein
MEQQHRRAHRGGQGAHRDGAAAGVCVCVCVCLSGGSARLGGACGTRGGGGGGGGGAEVGGRRRGGPGPRPPPPPPPPPGGPPRAPPPPPPPPPSPAHAAAKRTTPRTLPLPHTRTRARMHTRTHHARTQPHTCPRPPTDVPADRRRGARRWRAGRGLAGRAAPAVRPVWAGPGRGWPGRPARGRLDDRWAQHPCCAHILVFN